MPLELLSRIQFGFTISFHILFPAFSIGLITFIVIFETLWLKTKNLQYLSICKFWTKVLALTFGMGIVSGIVMEFQLGTNWSNFTHTVGNVLGVLFTYEVLTAFFIEAGFLGIMFFGWNRVSPTLHYCATILALIGVTLSAFWIMSANSWMQMPAGVNFEKNVFTVNNWWDVIFNPTFIPRFFHMLIATYISALFAVMAVCAYYLLKNQFMAFSKTCLSVAIKLLIVLVPLQILIGDAVGLNVFKYQPIKTAAIEGVWNTQSGAPFLLFAWPNQEKEINDFAISIPKLASLINTHEWNGELTGLKSVPKADRPNVPLVFYSFRIMVGLWLVMFLLTLAGLYFLFKKALYTNRFYLKCLLFSAPIGFVSIITGWFTAEFGRQPWVVYQALRTAAAASPTVKPHQIAMSLALIVIVYGIIFGYFYFRYFFNIIKTGPEEKIKHDDETFYYLSPTMGDSKQKE